jgi:dTDP-glucose pyrophosphorylase
MIKEHNNIIEYTATIKQALEQLNNLQTKDSLTLFVVNSTKLVGTLTDGDIRRGLLQGKTIDDSVESVMQKKFKYLQRNNFSLEQIAELKAMEIKQLPIVNDVFEIEKIIDLSQKKSVLPIDAVIMAGGEGMRLRPLTLNTPKPLIKIGDKPIIEYNIDSLNSYGVDNLYITIKYLGEKIVDYFKDGKEKNIKINYTKEGESMGTIGSITLIDNFLHDNILVMNSDILTNIDFEDFYKSFQMSDADMAVATIPYQVTLPYGIVECDQHLILGIKEKPTYTYYSNAGIYLIKKSALDYIPKNTFYNATDLMQSLLDDHKKVFNYPILGYWLDIGKHEDYIKAQQDVQHLKF